MVQCANWEVELSEHATNPVRSHLRFEYCTIEQQICTLSPSGKLLALPNCCLFGVVLLAALVAVLVHACSTTAVLSAVTTPQTTSKRKRNHNA
jgi:hypothetical protein